MGLKVYLQVLLILVVAFISSAHKSPGLQFSKHLLGSRKGDTREGIHSVKAYLHRYGYLTAQINTTNNNNNNNDSHPDTFNDLLESAVKTYQKFFQLNVTGVLDEKTLGQMAKTRCGVSDSFRRAGTGMDHDHIGDSHYSYFPGETKWPRYKTHLTYGFINNFPIQYEGAVMRAFGTWEASTRFSFSQAPRIQTADIVLSFETGDHGDGHPFDPAGQSMAHAFGPIDGRIHFNTAVEWSDRANIFSQFDMESGALHEIGHILGLGHSVYRSAIMWPDMDAGEIRTRLHQDDINGIKAIY